MFDSISKKFYKEEAQGLGREKKVREEFRVSVYLWYKLGSLNPQYHIERGDTLCQDEGKTFGKEKMGGSLQERNPTSGKSCLWFGLW